MDEILTIPVQATYRIVGGEAVQIKAEYAQISADAFARFLLKQFGANKIVNGEAAG